MARERSGRKLSKPLDLSARTALHLEAVFQINRVFLLDKNVVLWLLKDSGIKQVEFLLKRYNLTSQK